MRDSPPLYVDLRGCWRSATPGGDGLGGRLGEPSYASVLYSTRFSHTRVLPMNSWPQWLYQYVLGGAMFVATVALALRVGALRWRRARDRHLLLALAAGLLLFAVVHAAWIALVGQPAGAVEAQLSRASFAKSPAARR